MLEVGVKKGVAKDIQDQKKNSYVPKWRVATDRDKVTD